MQIKHLVFGNLCILYFTPNLIKMMLIPFVLGLNYRLQIARPRVTILEMDVNNLWKFGHLVLAREGIIACECTSHSFNAFLFYLKLLYKRYEKMIQEENRGFISQVNISHMDCAHYSHCIYIWRKSFLPIFTLILCALCKLGFCYHLTQTIKTN